MKSLAALSKYLGCYDLWTNIRNNYQLVWSNGDSLDIFNKIFADKQNYSSMMGWLKKCARTFAKARLKYIDVLYPHRITG